MGLLAGGSSGPTVTSCFSRTPIPRTGPQMLTRAIAGLREDGADLMTVMGQQLMESFWERLVQPQIFLLMLFRFPDFERAAKNSRWRDAIANGQYILFPRRAYDEIGGYASVRGEVVEDMALAMLVKREGKQLRIRSAGGRSPDTGCIARWQASSRVGPRTSSWVDG